MANEKPPIGVNPWWFIYPKRVIDLSEAITRYANYSFKHSLVRRTKEDYKVIYQWAMEIAKIAETMVLMSEGMTDENKL